MDRHKIQDLVDFESSRIVLHPNCGSATYKNNFANISVDGNPVSQFVSCCHCRKVVTLCANSKSNLYRHIKYHDNPVESKEKKLDMQRRLVKKHSSKRKSNKHKKHRHHLKKQEFRKFKIT